MVTLSEIESVEPSTLCLCLQFCLHTLSLSLTVFPWPGFIMLSEVYWSLLHHYTFWFFYKLQAVSLWWMLVMSSFSTFWQASSFRPLYKPESPRGASFQQDLSVLGAVTSVIIKIDGLSLALCHLTLQSAPSTAVQGWNWAMHYLSFYLLTSAIQLFWWETDQSACPCTLTFQSALIEIISYKHTHLKEIVQLKKGTYSLSCQELDEKINSQTLMYVNMKLQPKTD